MTTEEKAAWLDKNLLHNASFQKYEFERYPWQFAGEVIEALRGKGYAFELTSYRDDWCCSIWGMAKVAKNVYERTGSAAIISAAYAALQEQGDE